jgi:hypothetical protein
MIARWSTRGFTVGLLMVTLVTGIALALAGPAWASETAGVETFGIESFASSIVSSAEGASATQAGSNPYAMTTAIVFNHVVTAIGEPPRVRTYGDPKDIEVNLPTGMIVNPRATEARCTEAELESPEGPGSCPNAAAVGVFSVYLDGAEVLDEPVYNMASPADVPAELGFNAAGVGVIMHVGGRLRTGTDYGLSADISDISAEHSIYGLELTLWGNPSEGSHDEERGLCADGEAKQIFKETGIRESCPVERATKPFLTLPTSCANEPLTTTVSTDSWKEPGGLNPDGTPNLSDPHWKTANSSTLPVVGCPDLDFAPVFSVRTAEPEAASAESPSGLSVDLKLPHEESVDGDAEADLKEAAITLPVGMAVSPSAAGGREACTPEEIELDNAKEPSCPDASKIGTAKIVTPLLEAPLEGSIYLAQPYENEPAFGSPEHPGGSFLALYLIAENEGLLIKLAGEVRANSETGQLTVSWKNLPQLPIGEMKLSFFGGERALLVTPPACGNYAIQSTLTPWSGTPAVAESSNLEIASGPDGGACPSGGFAPSFTAGTVDNQAGASSAFTLTLTRQDGEQRFGAFVVTLPPGLLGILKNVAQCPEPQASQGECSPASEIGTTTVGVGPGADQFFLPEQGQPTNKVYLTGPIPTEGPTLPGGSTLPEGLNQSGAPFGLSIVVPAIAGPFNLGNIVMRAKVEVDPRTAQLTISSLTGVGGIPIIEQGIPLDIRTLNLSIDRPGFIVNPTSCAPQRIDGTIASAGGTSGTNVSAGGKTATVESPFQAANCASLPFKPRLEALTHARTSKADGAYLHVRVVSGPGQANIAKVKVDLPKQLPSRLTTLQQACLAKVFEADPAACPAASIVGTATVVTPMLAGALSGPAYLVSHGVAAFPVLAMVLQGDGIEIDLEGQTNIAKGITSVAFRSLPDTPIGTLDLVLPAGPHSAFGVDLPRAAKRGLCAQTLRMPTAIVGQNGAQLEQVTKIGITGCQPTRARHKRARRGRSKRKPARREQRKHEHPKRKRVRG